ncbi:MAG: hypothetical protein RTU30_09325 [Candidatus Thorarchaeota archaeon]
MRVCPKCNKSNRPERKHCIRCGTSLLKPLKAAPTKTATPKPTPGAAPVVETPAAAAPSAPPDEWVKPSEVSRDRVRTAGGGQRKSELEKAREAFARAEEAGIDESGTGVIEPRMLRASEVKELLEGPEAMAARGEIPTPTMMEGSEPLPAEAEHMIAPSAPTTDQIESSILGSKSAYVQGDAQPAEEEVKSPFAPAVSDEFSSSRYEGADTDIPIEPVTPPTPAAEPAISAPPAAVPDYLDRVTECSSCGTLITIDMFEYPSEVYSAMGAARLKQARFLVVQGMNDIAAKELRIARALFEKAEDSNGIKEAAQLVDSLART